jgi:hypothetical protein
MKPRLHIALVLTICWADAISDMGTLERRET